MPGISSNVQTFRNTKWLDVDTGQWTTSSAPLICDGSANCNNWYGKQNLGGGTYYVWDTCQGSNSPAADPPDLEPPSGASVTPQMPSPSLRLTLRCSDSSA